jgi:hypothetical protein
MSEKFRATFENGGFWEYYEDLEHQFENFLEYFPYLEGNENTYSFKLANMILAIGAHVDSAFKEMASYAEFSSKYPEILKPKRGKPKKPTIADYYVLSEEYKLPQKTVIFKRLPEREPLTPFHQYQKIGKEVKTPYWWTVYNGVKHKFKKNLEKATLQNTRDALAAAFLLNVTHIPGAWRLYKYGILKIESYYDVKNVRRTLAPDIVERCIKRKEKFEGFLSTPIFIYDYNQ